MRRKGRKEAGIVNAVLRPVIDSGLTEARDRNPKIQDMPFEDIMKLMLSHYLEKHPLVMQRIGSLRIEDNQGERLDDIRLHAPHLRLLSVSGVRQGVF